jgi:uncharacterized protein YlxW (UPF0749 family)
MIEKDHLQRERDHLQSERDHLQRQIRSLEALVADRNNQLADLKRSRLLKIGRLLRRLVGLSAPY